MKPGRTRRHLMPLLATLYTLTASPAQAQHQVAVPATDKLSREMPRKVFFSGHSLLENPVPQDVSEIARSLGTPLAYEQQMIPGSPIRVRTRGPQAHALRWTGYQIGNNRQGSNLDILAELSRPPNPAWPYRYDALVITERHDLLSSLVWEDTLLYLRHYHDRLVEANPGAHTWLYQPWWSIPNKHHPRDWIDYERAAGPIWRCVATRTNLTLQRLGRADRVFTIPANLALAELVERGLNSKLKHFQASSTQALMDLFFRDEVHLTRLGAYYVALVTYASVFKQSPQGAWAPPEVAPEQAQSLQGLAWEVAQKEGASVPLSVAQCGASIRSSFCATFWNFVKRPDQIRPCHQHFAEHHPLNPFRLEATKAGP